MGRREQLNDYLDSLNLPFGEALLHCYQLLKQFRSGSDEDKIFRGDIAEFVNKLLIKEFIRLNPAIKPKSLQGAIFSTGRGTTEIDNILITTKGVFVIEVKSFYGKFVIEQDGVFKWVDRDTKFTPLAQNSSHCRTIYRLIKNELPQQNPYCIRSIVAIFGDCAFQDMRTNKEQIIFPVCHAWDVFKHTVPLVKADLPAEQIYKILANNNINSAKVRQEHIKYVNSMKKR